MAARGRQFVPVIDQETPRCERDDFSENMQAHRKFDAPHAVKGNLPKKRGKFDRGWATGTVGWGVQGFFGSVEADKGEGLQQRREFDLVKDKFGRWIKKDKLKKREEKAAQEAATEQGDQTEVAAPHDGSANDDDDNSQHDHQRSHTSGRERRRSHSRSPSRRRRSRSRSRERGHRRHGSRSRSRSRSRSPRHHRSRRSRSRSRERRHHRRSSRSRSRDRHHRRQSRSPDRSRRYHDRDSHRDDRDSHRRSERRDNRPSPSTTSRRGHDGASTAAAGGKKGKAGKKWDPEWGWI